MFSELTKKFPAVYGTRSLIAIFIRFRHLSLSWTRLIQSTPILFVDTIFWSTSWFSKWAALDLSFKTLCISLLFIRATCSTPVIPVWSLDGIWWIVPFCYANFSPVSCYIFPSGPNIFLSTLFWNTLSQCTSLNLKDIVSHPHERRGQNYSFI